MVSIDNPDALAGHEGHHVEVTGKMTDSGSLHVDKVKMLAQKGGNGGAMNEMQHWTLNVPQGPEHRLHHNAANPVIRGRGSCFGSQWPEHSHLAGPARRDPQKPATSGQRWAQQLALDRNFQRPERVLARHQALYFASEEIAIFTCRRISRMNKPIVRFTITAVMFRLADGTAPCVGTNFRFDFDHHPRTASPRRRLRAPLSRSRRGEPKVVNKPLPVFPGYGA